MSECIQCAGEAGDAEPPVNGCGFERGSSLADSATYEPAREKDLYNVTMFSADTYYCHHLNKVWRELTNCTAHAAVSSADAGRGAHPAQRRHICRGPSLLRGDVRENRVSYYAQPLAAQLCPTRFTGKYLKCDAQRRPPARAHTAGCTPERCPFLAEGKECPYAPLPAL